MRKTILLFFIAVMLILTGSFTQKTVVWEKPAIGCSSFNHLSIEKVVLSKDTTSVFISINYPPNGAFRYSKDTYIETDGHKYTVIGSDSIVLDEWTYTDPKSWSKEFVLHFPSLPANTRQFDLLETTDSKGYNFFAIHPSESKIPEARVPKEFGADYPETDVWPTMEYSEEPATIHFKALNYKPGMGETFELMYFDVKNPTVINPNMARVVLDNDGCADFTFVPYYPLNVQIVMESNGGYPSATHVFLAPGKEVTVLVDMLLKADSIHDKFVGYKGYLAKTDRQNCHDSLYDERPFFPDIISVHSVADLAGIRETTLASIEEWEARHENQDIVFYGRNWADLRFMSIVADECDSLFRSSEFRDYIIKTQPECLFGDKFRIDFDLLDIYSLFEGTDVKGFGPDFCRYLSGVTKLYGGRSIQKPVIYDANLSRMYDEIEAQQTGNFEKLKASVPKNIHFQDELVDVALDKTFQTIIDRHKGKTVVVDMWETWCVPCRIGHEEMAPLKEELKNSNVEFVYLSSQSSPLDSWVKLVKAIPGEHYYLSNEQSESIAKKFNTGGGVPAYIFVNPKGKVTTVVLGWGGLNVIKEKLDQAMK